MTENLPDFPYYADPLTDGCFEERAITCEVCGQHRKWAYIGGMYAENDPESICPWCVADGSAAAKFNGMFQDASFSNTATPESVNAVLTRTPTVAFWNPIHWPDHCGECCTYVGDVQPDQHGDLLQLATIQQDLSSIGAQTRLTPEEVLNGSANGSLWLRLFNCRHCDAYRLALDLD